MINQPTLFQLYRQMTGSTVYVPKTVPVLQEQKWQSARITEYAFMHVEV